ncbi:MAG TPA: isoaspartyl peptidase/L-asparaginase [Thermoanaerobaculia bacterium]|nr:isoaspartyl peptidase/L-asparaginase [Thermoanaerobaculia bacterium]
MTWSTRPAASGRVARPVLGGLAAALLAAGCGAAREAPRSAPVVATSSVGTAAVPGRTAGGDPQWALAIHGGAGTIARDLPAERRAAYHSALARALAAGAAALERGDPALAVVEQVVRMMEDEPLFNAGRGAVFTAVGTHELDAAIMDGRDLAAGAVAAVTTVRHPVTLARLVMIETPHVLLVGDGAEEFATQQGVERVENRWFDTAARREAWERSRPRPDDDRDTVGAVARDRDGHLAAATSTGGTSNKRWGRVGDVPILGAGTYADDRTAALSATGKGEEFIRHGVTRSISARMEIAGESLAEAARHVIHQVLQPEDGGVIGVDGDGTIVFEFNSTGMYRGAADSAGRFEVGIWDELTTVERPRG